MYFHSKPDDISLTASIKDYLILTDETIIFKLYFNGAKITEEVFYPDDQGLIRIAQLGKVMDAYLCGSLDTEEQPMYGDFTVKLNLWEQVITAIRCDARTDILGGNFMNKYPLNLGHTSKVTYKDKPEQLALILDQNKAVKVSIDWVDLLDVAHHETGLSLYTNTLDKRTCLLNVGYNDIFAKHYRHKIWRWHVYVDDEANGVTYTLDARTWPQLNTFRFLNSFTVPDTVHSRGTITRKGQQQYTSSIIYGMEQKTDVERNDTYECSSGAFYSTEELHLFREMLSSYDVRLLISGQWRRIVITEYKENTPLRPGGLPSISFTYKLADQGDNFRLLR